jgi:uncharacterized protein (TIGR00369 family)
MTESNDYETRVRESFKKQAVMHTIGAVLTVVRAGYVEIELPYREDLCQQHGFIHAGIISTVLDSACGYAAFSVMPEDAAVLSIEFKVNLLSPARGEFLIAEATVKREGRTVIVCTADAFSVEGDSRKLVATMLGTMMCVRGRAGMKG